MPEPARSHISGAIGYLLSTAQTGEAWLGALLAILAAKLIPTPVLTASVMGLLGLVLMDFATGRLKSKRMGEKLSSTKMGRTVEKLFIYLLVPGFVALITLSTDPLAKFAIEPFQVGLLAFFSVREAKSIGENLHELGYPMPRWFWKRLPGGEDQQDDQDKT